jgi:hypothetical protein
MREHEHACVHSEGVMILLGEIKQATEDNGDHIRNIEKRLLPLEIDAGVAKKAGAWEGKKWGAIVAMVMMGIAEAIRRSFP